MGRTRRPAPRHMHGYAPKKCLSSRALRREGPAEEDDSEEEEAAAEEDEEYEEEEEEEEECEDEEEEAEEYEDDEQEDVEPEEEGEEEEKEAASVPSVKDNATIAAALNPSPASFFDLDILRCNTCMEALRSPIFQCCNGHYVCSACTLKLNNKCPTCLEQSGKIRNLGLEKIIESLRVSCKFQHHGCLLLLTLGEKKRHEDRCLFTPFDCPVVGCHFYGPSTTVVRHFYEHKIKTLEFIYCKRFTALLSLDDEYMLLKSGMHLFLLQTYEEDFGKLVYIPAFGYPELEKTCNCYLETNIGTRRLSLATTIQKHNLISNLEDIDFLLIPKSFFASQIALQLEVTIFFAPELLA